MSASLAGATRALARGLADTVFHRNACVARLRSAATGSLPNRERVAQDAKSAAEPSTEDLDLANEWLLTHGCHHACKDRSPEEVARVEAARTTAPAQKDCSPLQDAGKDSQRPAESVLQQKVGRYVADRLGEDRHTLFTSRPNLLAEVTAALTACARLEHEVEGARESLKVAKAVAQARASVEDRVARLRAQLAAALAESECLGHGSSGGAPGGAAEGSSAEPPASPPGAGNPEYVSNGLGGFRRVDSPGQPWNE